MDDLSADVTSPFLLKAVCKYENQAKEGDGKCTCFKFGRPDAAAVAALAPTADADVYICGPVDFMKSMSLAFAAAGVPAEQIHTEAFGTGNQS